MADTERRPFAASVRHAGLDWRDGSFTLADAEDPMRFPMSPQDERARQARLEAPPMQGTVVTDDERRRLVSGCLDGILASAARRPDRGGRAASVGGGVQATTRALIKPP